MRYVRSLDGVRGWAVLLVVLFHYGYFAAGWIGVQIFFTLSGYLITSILLEDKQQPLASYLGHFYWRRTLRIVPLYFVFLGGVVAIHAALGVPQSLASDWPYLVTYTANFARLREDDIGPSFVHLWSLAVEEQFYLLWPLLLYLLPLPAFRRAVAGLLLLTPLVRLGLYFALGQVGIGEERIGRAIYALPFTQLDAFAAGAAIPLWNLQRLRHAERWFLATLGLTGLLGLAVLAYGHFWGKGAYIASLGYGMYLLPAGQFVWGYSLLNILSLLGIICCLQQVGPLRGLDNWLLVQVGRVSYGVYVYHVPVLLAMEWLAHRVDVPPTVPGRFGLFVAYVAVVLLISEASFRWLESPFLRLKDSLSKRASANVLPGHSRPEIR